MSFYHFYATKFNSSVLAKAASAKSSNSHNAKLFESPPNIVHSNYVTFTVIVWDITSLKNRIDSCV